MGNEMLSEKVSVNINSSTLSQIDLLVDQGYYSNRSDFINQALREGLQAQRSTLDRIIQQEEAKGGGDCYRWFMGMYGLTRHDVEKAAAKGQTMRITGYGVLAIDEELDDHTLFATVERITLKGKAVCRRSIKEHYGLK